MRLAAVLLVVVLALSGCSSADTGTKDESKRLPDVTLQPLDDGDPVALADLEGPMVINLWASWCGPCKRELPKYESFAQKYDGKVDVLGVDWQETREDAARELASDSGVTYPLVTDPEGKLRTQVLPKLILLDADGTVAFEKYVEIKSVAQLEDLVEKHLGVTA
jgi:cytochrome c biogenesis protein CcmG, thiol:disulfide interchange protein DsbE